MRRLLALVLAAIPVIGTATVIRFDPPNPVAGVPVTVHVTGPSNGPCLTSGMAEARTVLNQGEIRVDVLDSPRCNGLPGNTWYNATAPIPPLGAGVYKVSVAQHSGNAGGEPTLDSTTLTVRDAAPSFEVIPNVVTGLRLSESVTLSGPGINAYPCRLSCPKILVHLGETVVDVSGNMDPFDRITVKVPPHTPGTVDVSIDVDGVITHKTTAALHFTGYGTGDPAFFENVLVPVLLTGPGAFGSQWKSELDIYNGNDFEIAGSLVSMCDPPPCAGPQPKSLFDRITANIPNGLAFPLPRQAAPKVTFGLLVRDLTKQAEALGTELPVIREAGLRDGELSLLNVPTDNRFRLGLRLYGIDDVRGVTIRIRQMNNSSRDLAFDQLALPPTETHSGQPPTFLFLQELLSKYPQLAGAGPIRLDIDAAGARVWGFITVTNNETQHVTVISPQ